MSEKVYFVCRSEYEAPLGHRLVEFEAPDLLTWFQRNWLPEEEKQALLSPEVDGVWGPGEKPEMEWEDDEVELIYDYREAQERTERLFQGPAEGFLSVWQAMARWEEAIPSTWDEFAKFIGTAAQELAPAIGS